MPKVKGIYASLPKILYRDTVDHMLFGYVLGFRNRNLLKILEVREACKQFIQDLELSEEELSVDSAVKTFYRMHLTHSEFVKFNRAQYGESTTKGDSSQVHRGDLEDRHPGPGGMGAGE